MKNILIILLLISSCSPIAQDIDTTRLRINPKIHFEGSINLISTSENFSTLNSILGITNLKNIFSLGTQIEIGMRFGELGIHLGHGLYSPFKSTANGVNYYSNTWGHYKTTLIFDYRFFLYKNKLIILPRVGVSWNESNFTVDNISPVNTNTPLESMNTVGKTNTIQSNSTYCMMGLEIGWNFLPPYTKNLVVNSIGLFGEYGVPFNSSLVVNGNNFNANGAQYSVFSLWQIGIKARSSLTLWWYARKHK